MSGGSNNANMKGWQVVMRGTGQVVPMPLAVSNPKAVFRAFGFGDPHLALPGPGTRDRRTFQSETEDLFDQILANATLAKAHAVFCTGDWFHLKAATSFETVRWTMALLRPLVDKFGPIKTVAGNHDMVGNNLADAAIRQPISILEAAGLIERVDLKPYIFTREGQSFAICGTAYPNIANGLAPIVGGGDVPSLRIMHGDVQTEGVAEQTMRGPSNVPACLVNGHIHTPTFDIVRSELNDKVKYANRLFAPLGTLTRVSRAEADWTPRGVIVTLTTSGVRAVFTDLSPMFPGASAFEDVSLEPHMTASAESLQDFARYLASHASETTNPAKMLLDYCFDDDGRCRHPAGVYERAKRFLDEVKV